MDRKFTCYCGLYCENCAVKVKVEPAAKVLYDEMKAAGFEEVISFIPGGDGFWPFLNGMANDLLLIAKDDELGRKLQDLGLPIRKRAPQRKGDFYNS